MAINKIRSKNRAVVFAVLIASLLLMLLLMKTCVRHEAGPGNVPPPVEKAPAARPEPPAPEPEKKAPVPEKPVVQEKKAPLKAPPETPPAEESTFEPVTTAREVIPVETPPATQGPAVQDMQSEQQQPPTVTYDGDEILWAATRRANTEEAYRNYLSRFPGGKHAKEAKEILRSGMYPAGTNAQGYEEFIYKKTGALFVLVPAGEFWMGSPKGEGEPDEHPRKRVYLDAYYIGKYEVTIKQYEKFCEATGHSLPEKPWLTEEGDHPIIYPTWEDAHAYCEWAGLRLPTEAQWEKAARGNTDTTYYWGDKPARDMANFLGTGGRDKYDITSPVGSFPPNGYGICDMAGNIWEWCADWYKPDYYVHELEDGVIINPEGPSRGEYKVIRGGSWNYEESKMRPAFRTRLDPKHWYDFNGFRAAMSYMPQ